MKPYSSPQLKAILFGLIGFTCWVAADSCMKLAGALPVPVYEVIGVAAFSGMVMLFLIAALRGRLGKLRPRHVKGLSAMGVMMILTYTAVMFGLRYLPLVNFYTIVFMAPIFVGVLAALLLHEKIDGRKIAATVVGFIGVLIALDVFAARDAGNWIGYGFACLNMAVVVAMQLIMRFLGERESRECTAFYPRIAPVMFSLLACLTQGFVPMSGRAFLYSVLVGAVGSLGWFSAAEAYQRAPAATIAPYQYSQIASGALFGYAIWGDVPSAHLLVGASIIVASGIYIAVHTKKAEAVSDLGES